jgi:hypothetical protein
MPTRMTLDFGAIGDAMRQQGVRNALRDQAERIARAARAINSNEGVNADVTTSSGTRPTGRPYSRIESTAVDAEFGTSKTARRRVLGRAAEQGN